MSMSQLLSASCVIADVAAGLSAGDAELIQRTCMHLAVSKYTEDSKHPLAIILFGSNCTKNVFVPNGLESEDCCVSEDDGHNNDHNQWKQYSTKDSCVCKPFSHVEVVNGFDRLNCGVLTTLYDRLNIKHKRRGNVLDSLKVAKGLFENSFQKQIIGGKKLRADFILLIGDRSLELTYDEEDVSRDFLRLGITLTCAHIGKTPINGSFRNGVGLCAHQLPLVVLLSHLCFWSGVRKKRQVAKCRIPLYITDVWSVPVYVYLKSIQEPLPTLKTKRQTLSVKEPSMPDTMQPAFSPCAGGGNVSHLNGHMGKNDISTFNGTDKFAYKSTELSMVRNEILEAFLYGYLYGKQQITLTANEKYNHMKMDAEPSLKIVASMSLKSIQQWWLLGPSETVCASDANEESLQVMESLFFACINRNNGLLCRYTQRASSMPKPALLLPQLPLWYNTEVEGKSVSPHKSEPNIHYSGLQKADVAFSLVFLPFADDINVFSSFLLPCFTNAQLLSVDKFVKKKLLISKPSPSHERELSHQKRGNDYAFMDRIPSGTPGQTFLGLLTPHPEADIDSFVCQALHPLCKPKLVDALKNSGGRVLDDCLFPIPSAKVIGASTHQLNDGQDMGTRLPLLDCFFSTGEDLLPVGSVPNPCLQRIMRALKLKMYESISGQNAAEAMNNCFNGIPKHDRISDAYAAAFLAPDHLFYNSTCFFSRCGFENDPKFSFGSAFPEILKASGLFVQSGRRAAKGKSQTEEAAKRSRLAYVNVVVEGDSAVDSYSRHVGESDEGLDHTNNEGTEERKGKLELQELIVSGNLAGNFDKTQEFLPTNLTSIEDDAMYSSIISLLDEANELVVNNVQQIRNIGSIHPSFSNKIQSNMQKAFIYAHFLRTKSEESQIGVRYNQLLASVKKKAISCMNKDMINAVSPKDQSFAEMLNPQNNVFVKFLNILKRRNLGHIPIEADEDETFRDMHYVQNKDCATLSHHDICTAKK